MTAVEWFLTELKRMQYFIGNDMLEVYNQALEMERQQKEKMYTEEEVLKLLNHRSFDLQFKKDVKTSSEWFEKFKK
jgi:hypothetical protein